jgi:type II secretory pathway pseudopilin PulG
MHSTSRRGFTLLETVIAIGIILFGLLSVIALSTSSLVVSTISSDEFLATNFAREGIEVARHVRDSNWLAFDTDGTTLWNQELVSGTDYSAVMSLTEGAASGGFFQFDPNAFGDTCVSSTGPAYDCTALWYDSSRHIYFQTTASDFDSTLYTETAFSRMVYLYPLCRNDADETDEVVVTSGTCALGYTQVGIDVRSEVQWPGRNAVTSSYILEEYIYDWKF